MIIDIIGSNVIGQTAFILGTVGFFGGYIEKNLSKESKITILLLVLGTTAIYEIFIYEYKTLILSSEAEVYLFIKKLLIELLYNGLLTIILYPLMRRFGYKIEDAFKNQQILTRYF